MEKELIESEDGSTLGTVIKDEESATNTKVVVPRDQAAIPGLLAAIHEGCVEGKFTGVVRVNYSQGGVPNIVTEHVIKGLEGIFGDIEDEEDEIKLTE
jgi:hypothetical protein